jgi:hypothetical protein
MENVLTNHQLKPMAVFRRSFREEGFLSLTAGASVKEVFP